MHMTEIGLEYMGLTQREELTPVKKTKQTSG